MPYKMFDMLQKVDQAATVENKRLGPVLAMIAEQQKHRGMKRTHKAPRRQGRPQASSRSVRPRWSKDAVRTKLRKQRGDQHEPHAE